MRAACAWKESDRIEAMQTELRKMGARIEVDGDTVHIQGVALHAPNAPLSGHNDHRIVMALAVAAIASGLPAPALRGRGRGQELARVLERAARSWRQGGAEHRQTRRI